MAHYLIDTTAYSSAGPEQVFALLADPDAWPRWGRWLTSELEEADADGGAGVGAVRLLRSRSLGRTTVSRERVLELDAPHRYRYALLSGLPLRGYEGTVELTPDRSGTRVHWHSRFEGAPIGTGRLYRWILSRFIADAARRLATHAAAGPADPASRQDASPGRSPVPGSGR
jgi:uncharacterized protein YndB with AHSA1/START domain